MVDERRVRRMLQRVSEDITYLASRSEEGIPEQLADAERMAALKYVFVTTIEGCLDIAQHVCASEGWGPPSSNAEALRLLGRHDVLPTGLSDVMASAVGFRNVLVHGYVRRRRPPGCLVPGAGTRSGGVREPRLVLADRPDTVTPSACSRSPANA